jgi:translation initiation factor 1A
LAQGRGLRDRGALWDFDPEKGDIVHKYDKRDVEELKRRGFAEAVENLDRYA